MMTFDRDDLLFQLFDVANIEDVLGCPLWEDIDRSTILGLLDTAEKLAADHFEPCAKKADEIEPDFVAGKVVDYQKVLFRGSFSFLPRQMSPIRVTVYSRQRRAGCWQNMQRKSKSSVI